MAPYAYLVNQQEVDWGAEIHTRLVVFSVKVWAGPYCSLRSNFRSICQSRQGLEKNEAKLKARGYLH